MNGPITKPAVPTSFWVIAAISLLWNAFGACLYVMSSMGSAKLMASVPPAMKAYMATMPVWAHAGWAFGIWGSFAGSVLLLMRSRHAVTAFLVSLVGAIVSYAAQAMAGVLSPAEPIMILAVIGAQLWYARSAANKGYLA